MLLLLFWIVELLPLVSLLKQGTSDFRQRCSKAKRQGNTTSKATPWNIIITEHCNAKTLSAGTGRMAVVSKAAELISITDIMLGPVLASISGGVRCLVCWFNKRNISRKERPTVTNGRMCVLSKFIGRPIILQTPNAAAAVLASTSVPMNAKADWIIQPYTATTPITTPNLIISVLEYCFRILFTFAVENVTNK